MLILAAGSWIFWAEELRRTSPQETAAVGVTEPPAAIKQSILALYDPQQT